MNQFQQMQPGRMVQVCYPQLIGPPIYRADTIERVTKEEIILRKSGRFSRRTGRVRVQACAPEFIDYYIEAPAA